MMTILKKFFVLVTLYSVMTLSFAQNKTMYDDFFRQFLHDVQTHSIKNRDWDQNSWRSYVNSQLLKLPLTSKKSFYIAVQSALNDLGDHHSFLLTPETPQKDNQNNMSDLPSVTIEDGIGIINFPTFTGNNSPTEALFISLHQEIDRAKSSVRHGWIINLQNNLGGNMYPMLACLSDFWINHDLGGFYYYAADPKNRIQKITFNGKSFYSNGVLLLTYQNTYSVGTITLPTIVLIGSKTGSSAEFLTLALKRQPHITLAGQTTHGLATGNELMTLPNQLGHYMLTIANDLDEYDMPLLSEKIEPSIVFDTTVNPINEAKKLLIINEKN